MSGGEPPVSDDDLHAFVDGEILPDHRRDVEAFLAASPADAERVENWRRQIELMRTAFARVEAEPTPQAALLPRPMRKRPFLSLLRSCSEQPADGSATIAQQGALWRNSDSGADQSRCGRVMRRRALASAFAAGAVAALAAAFLASHLHVPGGAGSAPEAALTDESLAERTAAALAAFKPQKGDYESGGATTNPSPAANQDLLVVPNLSSVGLALVGIRAISAPTGETFCLFYGKGTEAPVALCIARGPDGGGPAFHVSRLSRAQSSPATQATIIRWREGNVLYALAGSLPEARLQELAVRIRADVAAFDAS